MGILKKWGPGRRRIPPSVKFYDGFDGIRNVDLFQDAFHPDGDSVPRSFVTDRIRVFFKNMNVDCDSISNCIYNISEDDMGDELDHPQ